ncbi:hypothetical protein A2397_00055 [Candidatus Amesbacteria bacterium RIFOXYB1_FULL_44_23]|uniref:Uncharacterized protein n=1 Tax=Candidatus Amesbacteria bacterium RIFOXYB1_FULL_44_23 TaxID=1797263 RepID=A0A1F4ZX35_9BACT|nr:MAG: hypothetical protein A2397_00055 [Candidatus Amesbacteria bacterium RIFOXYB1_FULL_44_23]
MSEISNNPTRVEIETPPRKLEIARLILPKDFPHQFSRIVGIPFQREQLQNISITVEGDKKPLIEIMNDLELIGETAGVPHLSVGGWTTQMGGFLKWTYNTSYLLPETSRSYLVEEGLGVQGMGLVAYEQHQQNGFGLDVPYKRNSGDEDIGGGCDYLSTEMAEYYASRAITLTLLDMGQARFARIYRTFPYQDWMTYQDWNNKMTLSSVVVREDGKRGLPRKQLCRGIWEVLPTMTDFFDCPEASFEPDGHNAFIKDGKVIFTDYEMMKPVSISYDSFMIDFGDTWYLEELRKNYPGFLRMYNFQPIGDEKYPTALDSIRKIVDECISETYYRSELVDPLKEKMARGDDKAYVRYAMAGIVGSRAAGRLIARRVLGSEIEKILKSEPDRSFTLEEMLGILTTHFIDNPVENGNHLHETCRVFSPDEKRLCFDIHLETMGLPIADSLRLTANLADVYASWPFNPKTEDLDRLINLPGSEDNPFVNVPKDILQNTLYSQIAGAFSNMKGLTIPGEISKGSGRVTGYDSRELSHGHIDFHKFLVTDHSYTELVINCEKWGITIDIDAKKETLTILAPGGVKNIPISQLNVLAYAAHVAAENAKKLGKSDPVHVQID